MQPSFNPIGADTNVRGRLCKTDLQKHPLETRFTVLTLLDTLMSTKRDGKTPYIYREHSY